MRDPWFPIAFALIVLICVWLGIFGPLPMSVSDWIKEWQPLLAVSVAITAAYVAYSNTNRTIRNNATLEASRRQRKHIATRASLPLALTEISRYAENSTHSLSTLLANCADHGLLPKSTTTASLIEPLPSETLKALGDFIEYSDAINIDLLANTLAWIQIHDSRVRGIVREDHVPNGQSVTRTEIQQSILDAASIYSAAAALYEYARRRTEALPTTINWDDVRRGLRNMRFWDEEYSDLYTFLAAKEQVSAGPFARLS